MKQIRIGKIVLTDAGEWNSTTGYPILAYVRHNGDGWWSFKANINSEPSKGNPNWVQATNVQEFINALRQATTDAQEITEICRAAEELRNTAEQQRNAKEATRNTAEQQRVHSEAERQSAEAERVAHETVRDARELDRVNAEKTRNKRYEDAEAERDTKYTQAEATRNAAFSTAEAERNTGENARKQQEQQRQEKEEQREQTFSNNMAKVNNAVTLANNAASKAEGVIADADAAVKKANAAAKTATDAAATVAPEVAKIQPAIQQMQQTFNTNEAQRESTAAVHRQQEDAVFQSKETQRDAAVEEATKVSGKVQQQEEKLSELNRDFGHYVQRPDVTLEVVYSGKRFNNKGELIADAQWNVGRLGAVERGLLYELLMGSEDNMVLGTALFVSHTVETYQSSSRDVYTPVYSALGTKLPISTYAVLWAGENYTDLLVSFRNDVEGANVMKVAEWGIFKSIATQYSNMQAKLDLKSFADGYYSGMRVGTADNLASRGEATEEEIMFRKAGGSNTIESGSANVTSIKGKTLVWNQLVKDGFSKKELTPDATYKYIQYQTKSFVTNHKYLVHAIIKSNIGSQHVVALSDFSAITFVSQSDSEQLYTRIVTIPDDKIINATLRIWNTNQESIGKPYSCKEIYCINLTQMFGEGNEPSTYEEFLERAPKVAAPYAYNEGELVNMCAEGIKTVGFNLWDESAEKGYRLGGDGLPFADNEYSCSDYIHITKAAYYIALSAGTGGNLSCYCLYDKDKNFISRSSFGIPPSIVNLSDAYIRFCYKTSEKEGVRFNYSDPKKNGTYEPYWESVRSWKDTLTKYFPDGLKRAGSAYDEFGGKKSVKRIGKYTFLPNTPYRVASWHSTSFQIYIDYATNYINAKAGGKALSLLGVVNSGEVYNGKNGIGTSMDRLVIHIDGIDTPEAMTEYINTTLIGTEIYYELAEPEVYEYDELNMSYKVDVGGTEEIVVADGKSSTSMPASVVYGIDAYGTIMSNKSRVAALEQKPAASLTADEVTKLRALINVQPTNLDE